MSLPSLRFAIQRADGQPITVSEWLNALSHLPQFRLATRTSSAGQVMGESLNVRSSSLALEFKLPRSIIQKIRGDRPEWVSAIDFTDGRGIVTPQPKHWKKRSSLRLAVLALASALNAEIVSE